MKKIRLVLQKYWKKIPPRHYWPLFVFLSLYFVVPYSEITVTLTAILYFKFEKRIRPVMEKLTKRLPDWLKFGGSIIFFLVMMDDTLMYVSIIAAALWVSRDANKDNKPQ